MSITNTISGNYLDFESKCQCGDERCHSLWVGNGTPQLDGSLEFVSIAPNKENGEGVMLHFSQVLELYKKLDQFVASVKYHGTENR